MAIGVQVSTKLRRTNAGYAHWCPGCKEMHIIPDSWDFDGNLDSPTFAPSVLLRRPPAISCCHYFLRAGQLDFCPDSFHELQAKLVPLPALPEAYRD